MKCPFFIARQRKMTEKTDIFFVGLGNILISELDFQGQKNEFSTFYISSHLTFYKKMVLIIDMVHEFCLKNCQN